MNFELKKVDFVLKKHFNYSVSCCGVNGKTFPLQYGNYFSINGYDNIVNMCYENFKYLQNIYPLDKFELLQIFDENNDPINAYLLFIKDLDKSFYLKSFYWYGVKFNKKNDFEEFLRKEKKYINYKDDDFDLKTEIIKYFLSEKFWIDKNFKRKIEFTNKLPFLELLLHKKEFNIEEYGHGNFVLEKSSYQGELLKSDELNIVTSNYWTKEKLIEKTCGELHYDKEKKEAIVRINLNEANRNFEHNHGLCSNTEFFETFLKEQIQIDIFRKNMKNLTETGEYELYKFIKESNPDLLKSLTIV